MRTAGNVFAVILASALAVGLGLTVWVGVTGVLAYQHLARIQSDASEKMTLIADDPSLAASELKELADDASSARDLTSGPIWDIAEQTPWIGPQLSAFHTLIASADDLLTESFLPLAAAAQDLSVDGLRPVDGRIDPDVLSEFVQPARAAAVKARTAADAVRDIDRTPLVGVLAKTVDRAGNLYTRSATFVDALARTSQLLPKILGQNGERSYLILVQNNAEWRSLGGISGSSVLLHTNNGAVSLGATESATALSQNVTQPVVALPADITRIYGTKPARYFHNLTQIPDFSVDGRMAQEFFRKKTGVTVNGVIAIDPVVLSYLLSATGPVSLPDGEKLSADNAPALLLNGVYKRYPDAAQQDAFFAAATGAVFQALLDGRGSAAGFISALSRAGDQRRLLMWNADADEQAVLTGTTVAGPLPESDAQTARFGVYLNDGTGSKINYFTKPEVSLSWGTCEATGRNAPRELTLHVGLTSTAPADAATSLPPYVTGEGAYGTPPGTAKVITNVYLPEDYEVVSADVTDGTGHSQASYDGRTVLTFGVDLAPQTSLSMEVVVRAVSSAVEAEAYVTPTADAALDPVVRASCGDDATPNAFLQ